MSPPGASGTPELVVRGRRVVTGGAPHGIGPASILIRGGVIVSVAGYEGGPFDCPVEDAGESVVMPGLVDTHVHINEPGRTEWEGFASATRAAAAGGATTLVDMPLNCIPATTSAAALLAKLEAATGQLWVDVGFWGGVVPRNARELRGMVEAAACGFKCFLVPSGVDEFPAVAESDLRAALSEIASAGVPLLVHAELPGPIEKAAATLGPAAGPRRYRSWLAARPRAAENDAIALLIRLAREFRAHVHIVHLSSAEALPILRRAKEDGVALTVETCPHYLTFAAEEVGDGATEFKCAPPVRERENRELLWRALAEGVIDVVVSDHSPCPPEMKRRDTGDFLQAWGGISSLQLGLPAVWTEARRRGYPPERLVEWMCQAPARLAGLGNHKGRIAPGYDADLVVWNPDRRFHVEPSALQHRHKLTPYAGRELEGVVEITFLRGRRVFDRGKFPAGPAGIHLLRGNS